MHANLHINAISRSQGRSGVAAAAYRSGGTLQQRSIVAAAAYRSGDKLRDEKESKTFDYGKKENIIASGMLAPDHAKAWARDREQFWNAVEKKEKRKDALLAKEALLVLPRNLSPEQQKQVVEGWAKDNLVEKRGLVVDYAIHAPDASDGGINYHAHVLYYPRPIAENGEFARHKLTGYNTPNTVDGKAALHDFRFSYQDHLNRASAENDNNQIVFDLRSYKERGINRIPQPKKGQKVTHLEKRGYRTEWNKEIRIVQAINQAKAGRERYIRTFSKFGSGNKNWSSLSEKARQQIANTYYDIMFGDGTAGSFERQNNNDYER